MSIAICRQDLDQRSVNASRSRWLAVSVLRGAKHGLEHFYVVRRARRRRELQGVDPRCRTQKAGLPVFKVQRHRRPVEPCTTVRALARREIFAVGGVRLTMSTVWPAVVGLLLVCLALP